MKKITIAILLLLTMILSPLSALAAQWPDSLTIDSDTRQILGVSEDSDVMRIYADSFLWSFGREEYSIEEIVEQAASRDGDTYYIYPNDDFEESEIPNYFESEGFTAKVIEDGVAVEKTGWYLRACEVFYHFTKQQDQILRTLGKNVVAEKIYYIQDNCYGLQDVVIYYVTNVGDYVLFSTTIGYKDLVEAEQAFFVPASEFRPIAKKISESRSEQDFGLGENSAAQVYIPKELEAYKLELPERNVLRDILLWSIPAVVILAAGGLWFILRRRKKKEVSPA